MSARPRGSRLGFDLLASREARSCSPRHSALRTRENLLRKRYPSDGESPASSQALSPGRLAAEDDAAGDDGGHGRATEGAAVEWSVARFAGRVGGAVGPLMIGRENCDVGWFADGELSVHAKNAGGAGGEKLDEARERKFSRMDEFAQAERESRLESEDAEGRTVEFDVLARGMMRGVIGGDGVHAAVGEPGDQGVAIGARSKWWIHFVVRVVADVLVGEREVMRRDFASNAQLRFFREAHIFERAECGHVSDVQASSGEERDFNVAAHADGFGLRGNSL